MAVHIRLTRGGAKKSPYYRLVVTDHRNPRDGKFIENLGTFDPAKDVAGLTIKAERLAYWQQQGAQPSHTVARLLKRLAASQAAAKA